MATLKPETRARLVTLSTTVVAAALVARGLRDQAVRNVRPVSPAQDVMVGPAFIVGPTQRVALEACPAGHVLVIETGPDAPALALAAASVTRLGQRGVAGLVTDGPLRDAAAIARLGLPAYHRQPGAPIRRISPPVHSGDIILGDAQGVLAIPAGLVEEIVEEAFEQAAFADFVAEQVSAGPGIYGLHPPSGEQALVAFREWRRLRGR